MDTELHIVLVDIDPNWEKAFQKISSCYAFQKVKVSCAISDIRQIRNVHVPQKKCAYVSPANCFGYMDGGIDEIYSKMFTDIGKTVRQEIHKHSKYRTERNTQKILPIGSSLVVPVNPTSFLICAPTMVFPNNVSDSRNAFAAMSAVLNVVSKHNQHVLRVNDTIDTIYIPGLCTGVGRMSLENSIQQMMEAIDDWEINGSLNAMNDDAYGIHHVFLDETFISHDKVIDLSEQKYIKIAY